MKLEEYGLTHKEMQEMDDALRWESVDFKTIEPKEWFKFAKANKIFREPGISYDEIRGLHEACELFGHRPIRIVETGMCFGTTTRYFIVRTVKYGGELHSYEVKVQPLFKEHMEKLDLWKYVHVHGNSVKDFYDGERIDMLFIDSEHALQDALGEYMRFRPFLYEHSIIGLHDCEMCSGVGQAIKMIQEVDELEVVSRSTGRLGAGVIFFKRKKTGRTDRPWVKMKGRELYESFE